MAFKVINYESYKKLLSNATDGQEFIYNLKASEYDSFFEEENMDPFPVELNLPAYVPNPKKRNFLSNDEFAIKFYESLKSLTRFQLSDKRLWATLTLNIYKIPCLEFGGYSSGQFKTSQVKKHFFYEGLTNSTVSLNLLSKIFWAVKQTFDKNSEDPYSFTKLLFSDKRTQTFQDLTQRVKFLSNKELTFGYLLFMSDKKDITSKTLAPLLLNHLFSYDLGNYNRDDIQKLLKSLLEDYINISE